MLLTKLLLIGFFILLVGCDSAKKDFQKAEKVNTIQAYEEFLSKHRDSKFSVVARKKIEVLQWQEAENKNTYESYASFIKKHPSSTLISEAYKRLFPLAEEKWQSILKLLSNIPKSQKITLSDLPLGIDIIPLPAKRRLLYIQETIYPGRLYEEKVKKKIYVLYDNKRGNFLVGWGGITSSEEVFIRASLIFLENGTLKNIGEFKGLGGEGCGTYECLVTTAIEKMGLPQKYSEFLIPIVGYATGVDLDKEVSGHIRRDLLIQTLKLSYNWADRMQAAFTLGSLMDKEAVLPLMDIASNDENIFVRNIAIEALGRIKDDRAVELLIKILKKDSCFVRPSDAETAAIALGEIKNARALEPLIYELVDPCLRFEAVEALDKINPQWRESEVLRKAIPSFINALKNKDRDVRVAAAWTLGEINYALAIDSLVSSLEDEDWFVRQAAVNALGKIKDKRAIGYLIDALKDSIGTVQYEALEALKSLTGQDFGYDTKKWQKWQEENKAKIQVK